MQSRYYSPEWGRFVNADALIGATGELLGHNVFSYCKNNSVNKIDPNGFIDVTTQEWEKSISRIDSGLSRTNEFLGKEYGQAATTVIDSAIGGAVTGAMSKAVSASWNSNGWYQQLPNGSTRSVGKFVRPSAGLSLASKAGNIGLGVTAVAATGLSIWDNHAHYRKQDAVGRTVVDLTSVGATMLAAAIIGGPIGLTGAAAIGAGFAAGLLISGAASIIKDNFFWRKK